MTAKFQPNRLASYDEDSILDEIRRVITHHFHGTPPPKAEFERFARVKGWVIKKRFGSWANAIMKAGFNYTGTNYADMDLHRDKFSKERMTDDLNRVRHLNDGEYFTYDYYKKHKGAYSIKTLKKYFGCSNWPTLLRDVLSLERKPKRVVRYIKAKEERRSQYSKDQLFVELKRVWDELGRRPTYTEFRRIGQIGTKVYERCFGSWTDAVSIFCKKYQYETQGKSSTNATPDLLLSEIQSIASRLNSDILTHKMYRQHSGIYSIGTFQAHFGSWENAIRRIGLKCGHFGKYSTDKLFEELQRLWEMLGKQPTYKDMNTYGKISGTAYQNRFGSWMKAIHAFCSDREKNDSEDEDILNNVNVNENKEENITSKKEIPVERGDNADYIVLITPRTPSLRLRFRVLQRDNFSCVYCGRSPATDHGLKLEVDHIVPYTKGGQTVLENLQTLCNVCNRGKSDSSG